MTSSKSEAGESSLPSLPTLALPRASLWRLPVVSDARGDLAFAEFARHMPFSPRRYFAMINVPAYTLRGDHAHRQCHQFFVCLNGMCTLMLDDGRLRDELVLDSPVFGVHAPPMTWCTVRVDTPDTVLLVFTSDDFDVNDYIREYDEFLRLAGAS